MISVEQATLAYIQRVLLSVLRKMQMDGNSPKLMSRGLLLNTALTLVHLSRKEPVNRWISITSMGVCSYGFDNHCALKSRFLSSLYGQCEGIKGNVFLMKSKQSHFHNRVKACIYKQLKMCMAIKGSPNVVL